MKNIGLDIKKIVWNKIRYNIVVNIYWIIKVSVGSNIKNSVWENINRNSCKNIWYNINQIETEEI